MSRAARGRVKKIKISVMLGRIIIRKIASGISPTNAVCNRRRWVRKHPDQHSLKTRPQNPGVMMI